MTSLSEAFAARQRREARARSQSFSFRLSTVKTSAGPVSVVYVTSHGSGSIYTITRHRHTETCCCPDGLRNRGTNQECKHLIAWRLHLEAGAGEVAAVPAMSPERVAKIEADRALWL